MRVDELRKIALDPKVQRSHDRERFVRGIRMAPLFLPIIEPEREQNRDHDRKNFEREFRGIDVQSIRKLRFHG